MVLIANERQSSASRAVSAPPPSLTLGFLSAGKKRLCINILKFNPFHNIIDLGSMNQEGTSAGGEAK
jgi:hypothetical protein